MQFTQPFVRNALVATILLGCSVRAHADTILWIDDTTGNIGQVDLTTLSVVAGSVHSTGLGSNLTDIGFTQNGTLYGTTFTGLYSINKSTGATTSLGSYGTEGGMNALVGDGASLLGAANDSTKIYSINPASPGSPATFATSPADSAGDLAFSGPQLFESGVAINGNDELINVSTDTVIGQFHTTSQSAFTGVFGLADDGTTMYAVNGNTVYSVNLSTALLTEVLSYSGNTQGLGIANGTAFANEASNPAPEPSTIAVFGAAIAGLGALRGLRRAR